MSAATVIALSTGQAAALLTALLLPLAAVLPALRRLRRGRKAERIEPDQAILELAAPVARPSLFATWQPSVKIGSLLCFCFLLSAVRSPLWATLGLLLALAGRLLSRLHWQRTWQRLGAMAAFLTLLVVMLPFSGPGRAGDTLFLLPLLEAWPMHLSGLLLAVSVVVKALAVALLMEPMLATAPLSRTLAGFRGLGLPPILIQMIQLSHRYLFVFQQEMQRMLRAARLRGCQPTTSFTTLRTLGNCLGMLFVRSFERTERVHAAMLCRGYQGNCPLEPLPPITSADRLKGLCTISLGLLLVLLDRLLPQPWL